MTNYFESAPDFIEEDNRRGRARNPVSMEQMHKKHAAVLPEHFVKGKTILDIGCCLGATGHWCLAAGASHYTGIEFQKEYADKAKKLLGKYHPEKFEIYQGTIEEWLAQSSGKTFDVVCAMGVIYVFIDYYWILKTISTLARETIVFENMYPEVMKRKHKFRGVEFLDSQTINIATEESSFVGRGTRFSPRGLEWLMKEFHFIPEGGSDDLVILPEPITGGIDVYNRPIMQFSHRNPVRYLMRFVRSDTAAMSLSEILQKGEGKKEAWVRKKIADDIEGDDDDHEVEV